MSYLQGIVSNSQRKDDRHEQWSGDGDDTQGAQNGKHAHDKHEENLR